MPRSLNLALAGTLFLLALLAAGCSSVSGDAGTGSFAHVTIKGHTLPEVQAATDDVFRASGYEGGRAGPTKFQYWKGGSRADQYAYGGILASDGQISYRVDVTVRELDDSRILVQCDVFRLRQNGDPFFNDEVALRPFRSGPYQLLLNKIKGKLK